MPHYDSTNIDLAPAHWADQCTYSENKLHQISPYIGKLKSSIAADLIREVTEPGDVVLDPFCGSGTIPFECVSTGRIAYAYDSNPYAVLLTKAKLSAPSSISEGIARAHVRLKAAKNRTSISNKDIPAWVRDFFHPSTLKAAIAFADECKEQDDAFMLACLLGILHHQRPGFLSYPSSHLVPYLRDKKFPRSDYPDMYEMRELAPRLLAKVKRALKQEVDTTEFKYIVQQKSIEDLSIDNKIDAIITSPPYMNALDYVRDNRLRMWFLDRSTSDYQPELTDSRSAHQIMARNLANKAITSLKKGGHIVLVVGEKVKRKSITSHPAEFLLDEIMSSSNETIHLEKVWADTIPDVRRSRRKASATKRELIMFLRKVV